MSALHDAADTQPSEQARGRISQRARHVTHVLRERRPLVETAPSRMSLSPSPLLPVRNSRAVTGAG